MEPTRRSAELSLHPVLLCRHARKLHFQLQVTIGSYGYEPIELYLVHGVLAFLALVVMHCILTQVRVADPAFAEHAAALATRRPLARCPLQSHL